VSSQAPSWSRVNDSTNGGATSCVAWATSLRLLVRTSCLYLDPVRRARPFTATDPFSYLMLFVLIGFGSSRDSEGPEKVWGAEALGEGLFGGWCLILQETISLAVTVLLTLTENVFLLQSTRGSCFEKLIVSPEHRCSWCSVRFCGVSKDRYWLPLPLPQGGAQGSSFHCRMPYCEESCLLRRKVDPRSESMCEGANQCANRA
jgi:hypothetical protein